MIPTDPESMERAKLTALGMAQFEVIHGPVRGDVDDANSTIICDACQEDWPCQRMSTVLISQALMMLQQMLPNMAGGGVGGVIQRFTRGGQ